MSAALIPSLDEDRDNRSNYHSLPITSSSTATPPSLQVVPVKSTRERWYQRKWVRLFAVRVLIRLVMLTIFMTLVKSGIIPFSDLLHDYLDWIDSFDPSVALLLFGLCSIPFSAFTPGSYAPTVVAGLTFPWYEAFPLSYLCINLAALLNLIVIRYLLPLPCNYIKEKILKRREKRGDLQLATLDRLFLYHPLRTVILLRLPYLASGILNYLFSSSRLSIGDQLIGNAVGLLPGALLFTLLGAQARSLTEIIFDGKSDPLSIVVFVLTSLFVIVCIVGIIHLVKKKTVQQAAQVAITAEEEQPTGGAGQHEEQPVEREEEKKPNVQLMDMTQPLL